MVARLESALSKEPAPTEIKQQEFTLELEGVKETSPLRTDDSQQTDIVNREN